MHRVIWSESAQDDIWRVDRYLRQFGAAVAVRTLRLIRAKLDLLRDYPLAGPQLDAESRSILVRGTPYVIIYAVIQTEIAVLRLRDAREDWRLE